MGNTSGGVTVNLTTNAQVVTSSVGGQYAAPVISNGQGALFGNPDGVDTTRYITAGSTNNTAGAQAELVFSGGMQYLGLLWGSVDTYNTLTFHFTDNTTESITGADVTNPANGNQGVNGTYYVNINSTKAFDKVVATSTDFAFEFDNVAYARNPVPEPVSALLWVGLFGVTAFNRRRRTGA